MDPARIVEQLAWGYSWFAFCIWFLQVFILALYGLWIWLDKLGISEQNRILILINSVAYAAILIVLYYLGGMESVFSSGTK